MSCVWIKHLISSCVHLTKGRKKLVFSYLSAESWIIFIDFMDLLHYICCRIFHLHDFHKHSISRIRCKPCVPPHIFSDPWSPMTYYFFSPASAGDLFYIVCYLNSCWLSVDCRDCTLVSNSRCSTAPPLPYAPTTVPLIRCSTTTFEYLNVVVTSLR